MTSIAAAAIPRNIWQVAADAFSKRVRLNKWSILCYFLNLENPNIY